ncbi:MAG: CRISPR-associated endoribonuclease Cas6 [Thermosynechococcaceae cyanobacterium]
MPVVRWPKETELLSLTLELAPIQDLILPENYTTQIHSWFLDQVRRIDPTLSAYLHDGQSEKPFTISEINGPTVLKGRSHEFAAERTYQWTVAALSHPVVAWMQQWLESPPTEINLRTGPFAIKGWSLAQPPTTYAQLLPTTLPDAIDLTLSFLSPTSFRRKGSHFPLPLPFNLFHSYLRRWNDFSGQPVDQDTFLNWIDESVVMLRHQLRSQKVSVGKSGSVTGFTGAVQFGLTRKSLQNTEFVQLFVALGQLAPYCGTGHKTTFGLGQTRLGWLIDEPVAVSTTRETILVQRIAELTDIFTAQRKRTGGDRAAAVAQTWATILARRELGEGLEAIALDLKMPYETVKTYVKLACRALT